MRTPEFFSDGVKLIGIDGENGKIDLDKLENTLANSGVHGEHGCLPSVINHQKYKQEPFIFRRNGSALRN